MVDTIQAIRTRTLRFAETVQRIREAGCDSLQHFGNGYTREGGYSLQQNPDEIAALLHLLQERIGVTRDILRPVYLEIGSASGGTLRLLQETVGFNVLLSMDNHGHHRWVEQEENWRALSVQVFVGDSHSNEAKAWLDERLSRVPTIAFIDGDHSYTGVTQDVQLVRPHLASGSLMIFHDTVVCDGVKRAFEETAAWTDRIANYVGEGYRPLGIGVLEVP